MATQSLGLFQAIGAKLNYDNQRERVLSQNIANANTPAYKPKDLEKVDFGSIMQGLTGDTATIQPTMTNPMHLSPNPLPDQAASRESKKTYDVSPTGNAVVMEEQMVKSAETMTDYNLMTAIYQKQVSMMHISLGLGR